MEQQLEGDKLLFTGGAGSRPPGAIPDILTTHAKRFHPAWTARTVLLPGYQDDFLRFGRKQLSWPRSLLWSWRLFRKSRNYRAVITGSEHIGHVFALLQRLFRSRRTRVAHVLVDFPWAAAPSRLTLALKRLQIQVEASAITRIIAHGSPEEVERLATAFRIAPEKFTFLHYHHTLYGSQYEVSEGDYIFTGGDDRDYATLIKAVRDLPLRVIICALRRDYFKALQIPAHVEIRTVSQEEFDRLLGGAKAVVIPLPANDIHTGGHTVITNAMTMGKPVIVAGRDEYRAFIQSGVTGLLLPPGDVEALHDAIRKVVEDPQFAHLLGHNAKIAARIYAPEAFFSRVFDIIDEAGSVVPKTEQ